ncbi:hypothetical protein NIES4102_35920 [Chondrocystis sp. NIES-4102]|nr:hypothetical protein NIES4102_35920 [Chondrocystis sp. NIES-4102]
MKYFFLSEGWTYGRVWEFGGLWNYTDWGRNPQIQRLDCGTVQQGETLWLYAVEDAVLMIEVRPSEESITSSSIGQVVLKRLIDAEQVIEILIRSEAIFNSANKQ